MHFIMKRGWEQKNQETFFNLERFFFFLLACGIKGKKNSMECRRGQLARKRKKHQRKRVQCTPGEIGKPPPLLERGDYVAVLGLKLFLADGLSLI